MENKLPKQKCKKLAIAVEEILFRHDPEGIAFYDENDEPINSDEYAPEVVTILPRLNSAKNAGDVAIIVLEEFNKWFGSGDSPTNASGFMPIAKEIWDAMQQANS